VIGDSGRITAAEADGPQQFAGQPMTFGLIETITPDDGGNDQITTLSGNDIVFGGHVNDSIDAGDGNNIVMGDNGYIDYVAAERSYPEGPAGDTDPGDIDVISTINPTIGGADHITTGSGHDMILGGTAGDTIRSGADNDLIFGDHGRIEGNVDADWLPLNMAVHPFTFTAIDTQNRHDGGDDWIAGEDGDDIILGQQGSDTILGGTGDDDIFGGHNVQGGHDAGDFIDAGADDDVVAGDNASILRRGDKLSPRMRALSGSVIYDGAGNALVTGVSQGNPDIREIDPDERNITLYDHSFNPDADTWGDDYIAGGANDDVIFGQLGDDVIQGDALMALNNDDSVDIVAFEALKQDRVSKDYWPTDGLDYIEGNGGADLIFGNLGQDDIIGGSSSLFGLNTPDMRPDGSDTIYGGAGTDVDYNNLGDYDPLVDPPRGNDADVILGDNGNIYRLVGNGGSDSGQYLTFNYDNYTWENYDNQERVIPRAVKLLDYTPGNGTASPLGDLGAADLIHGESGDDIIYGMTGHDILFGEAQDDDIYGGDGSDRIYGGTGEDGIAGDNGLFLTSRNGMAESLYGLDAPNDPLEVRVQGRAGLIGAVEYIHDRIHKSFVAIAWAEGGNDILYGGEGDDWMHGGAGDDAMSGAEALPEFYTEAPQTDMDPLGYDSKTRKFAAYDAENPLVMISGFFLNFAATYENGDKVEDGKDRMFGDLGNDWLVGGTGKDRMFGGMGDDLLNADDNLGTNGGLNDRPDVIELAVPDIAFGGGGLDVLIANTGGDRLFDWNGEFNTYIVPFGPFGSTTVNRMPSPHVMKFLTDLGRVSGADQSLSEPYGELGLVTKNDPEWKDQKGGPRDPQPGNMGGVSRDTRGEFEDDRSPDFWPTLAGSTPGIGTVEPFASISGVKFFDRDEDGIRDADETGLSGWTVYLDADNDAVLDEGEAFATTAADGGYSFTFLEAGTYVVREVQQDGWTQTSPEGDGSYTLTLAIGEQATDVNFGNYQYIQKTAVNIEKYVKFFGEGTASIGNFVWQDLYLDAGKANNGVGNGLDPQPPGEPPINDGDGTAPGDPGNRGGAEGKADPGSTTTPDFLGNGIQDPGEPGIGGVVVNLLGVDGSIITSTTTEVSGFYQFTGLSAGNYIVEISSDNFAIGGVLEGWTATLQNQGSDGAIDSDGDPFTYRSDVVTLSAGENNTNTDFGYYLPGIVGGKANNGVGNGLDPQPPGEPPINDGEGTSPGDPGNQGGANKTDDGENTGSTVSGAGDTGTGSATPSSSSPSSLEGGAWTTGFGDDADDPPGPSASVGDQVTFTYVVTNPGEVELANVIVVDDNETPDDPTDDFNPDPMEAGGFNIGDTDQDGLLDPGEEWLYTRTTTVSEGQHVNVATVTAATTDGSEEVTDEDPAHWVGLLEGSASVGNLVWNDLDGDGIQDAGESGIGGVVVNLLDDNETIVASATTESSGFYQFTGLTVGTYIVEISGNNFSTGGVLEGWTASLKDQGTDDSIDSDGDPITFRSGPVTLATGDSNTSIDFGYYLPGDGGKANNGVGNGLDPQPPGNPPINDGEGTSPGDPGNQGGVKETGNTKNADSFFSGTGDPLVLMGSVGENDPNEDIFDSAESLGSWLEDFVMDLAGNGSDPNPNDDIQVVLPGEDDQNQEEDDDNPVNTSENGNDKEKETGKGKSK